MDTRKIYKSGILNNSSMLPGDLQGSPDESLILEDTLVFIDETFLNSLFEKEGKNGK